ncbi:MAG TPA: ABC transporter substrate-binding protein [Pelomicrobium sp.]|nr:ABC transporter substrate-binding protein [Pelomicrobium sp.]
MAMEENEPMRGTLLAALAMAVLAPAGADTAAARDQGGRKTVYMATWRGCEEACQSFRRYFQANALDAEVVVRDANRDAGRLPAMVREARALKADLVVTWGTSVTLGMAGSLAEKDDRRYLRSIPVVFMVVADPVGADVIQSYEKTGRANVTGVRNRVPETVNINTIRSYHPGFRRLGILYNTNERNSVLKMEELQALAREMKFELVALELELGPDGRPTVDGIGPKVAELKQRSVDFIYVGSSSFLRANADTFTGAALEHGLPVLSPYEEMVKKSNALLSVSARYADVGALAARQAKKILFDGASAGDLAVVGVEQYAYVVNMAAARKIKLFPPIDVLKYAETVN